MVTLHKSKEFIKRLERLDNPIANYIINLKEVDENSKDYINYLGISIDNPSFMSFLDKNKIERYQQDIVTVRKWYGNDCKVRLKKGAFEEYFNRGSWVKNRTKSLKPEYLSYYDSDAPSRYHPSYLRKEFKACSRMGNIPFEPGVSFKQSAINHLGFCLDHTLQLEGLHRTGGLVYVFEESLDHIEFIKVNEEVTVTNDLWNADKRIKASAAKIRRVIGDRFDELFGHKDIDDFISKFRYEGCKECGGTGEYLYEEVEGSRIAWAYNEDNYVDPRNSSQLWQSCMRYEACQEYFDIYTRNKNHVSLAILQNNGKIAARSILWYPNTKAEPTVKYFDRIYGYDSDASDTLRSQLENKGYVNIYDDDEVDIIKIELEYGEEDIDYFPYLDTMRYLKGRTLTNDSSSRYSYELTETDGGPANRGTQECDNCGSRCDSDDIYNISRGSARHDNLCDNCSTFCHDIDEAVANADAVYDDYARYVIYRDNAVELHDGKYCHEDDAIQLHDEEWCHDSEDHDYDVDDTCYLSEDIDNYCIEYNGRWYPYHHENVVCVDGVRYHIDSDEYSELFDEEAVEESTF